MPIPTLKTRLLSSFEGWRKGRKAEDAPPRPALGLERGTVRLADYTPEWRDQYLVEAQRIKTILAAANVGAVTEHFGSTAVRGLVAKPIVDIAVGFKSKDDIRNAIKALRANGYDYVPVANVPGSWFMARGANGLRHFHAHLMVVNSLVWKLRLETCRYLQRSRMARDEYQRAKVRLAKQFANDRLGYQRAKGPIVDVIEMRALAARRNRQIKGHLSQLREGRPAVRRRESSPISANSRSLLRHVPLTQFVESEPAVRQRLQRALMRQLAALVTRRGG